MSYVSVVFSFYASETLAVEKCGLAVAFLVAVLWFLRECRFGAEYVERGIYHIVAVVEVLRPNSLAEHIVYDS